MKGVWQQGLATGAQVAVFTDHPNQQFAFAWITSRTGLLWSAWLPKGPPLEIVQGETDLWTEGKFFGAYDNPGAAMRALSKELSHEN